MSKDEHTYNNYVKVTGVSSPPSAGYSMASQRETVG